MGNVMKHLIEPLEERFEWRNAAEEIAAKSDMLEEFARYDDALLARVAKQIRLRRTYRTMPLVGEISKAIHELLPQPKPTVSKGFDVDPEWTEEAIRRADRMILSQMGIDAAAGGWLIGLHDWYRGHHEMPPGHEIARMKVTARWFDDFSAKHGNKWVHGRYAKLDKLRAKVREWEASQAA